MTLTERKQREKAQRRKDILRAAEKLFFSRGYDNVSMDEIANEAELNKATLYFYFKDKESLYFAVVNRGIKILRAIISEEEKRAQASGLKFGAIGIAWGRFYQEYPDYARAYIYFRSERFGLFNNIANDKEISTDAKEVIEFTKEIFGRTFSVIKARIEDGTFRSDINPVVLGVLNTLILDSIQNISPFLRDILESNGISMQQFNQEMGNLVLHMVINTEMKDELLPIKERVDRIWSDKYAETNQRG